MPPPPPPSERPEVDWREQERRENERYDYMDPKYNEERENRWDDESYDRRHLHEMHDEHPGQQREHHEWDQKPFELPEPDITDYFYHALFFSELKWLFLLFAAITGLRHANRETYKEHKNKKSLRRMRFLVVFASIFFALEKYNERHFMKELRHLRKSLKAKDAMQVDPHVVSEAEMAQIEEEVLFLNERDDRHLHGKHHGGKHHGERDEWHNEPREGRHEGHDEWKERGEHHDGHRGGPHHGMKRIRRVVAILCWLALIGPLMHYARKTTKLRNKISKINKRCNEAQRAEINQKLVQKLSQDAQQNSYIAYTNDQLRKAYEEASKFTVKVYKQM